MIETSNNKVREGIYTGYSGTCIFNNTVFLGIQRFIPLPMGGKKQRTGKTSLKSLCVPARLSIHPCCI